MATVKKETKIKKAVVKIAKEVKVAKVKPMVEKMTVKKPMVKTLSGKVVSTKMQNTIVVAIERKVAHKLYRKLIKVTKKIKADTNGMTVKEGDTVKIQLTRPISKDKNYKLIEIKESSN